MVELAWVPDRIPSAGEHTATVIVAIPNAADTASRDQSKVSVKGSEHQLQRELHQPRRRRREDAPEVGGVEVGDRQPEVRRGWSR